jgi:hypothetical protein
MLSSTPECRRTPAGLTVLMLFSEQKEIARHAMTDEGAALHFQHSLPVHPCLCKASCRQQYSQQCPAGRETGNP